jgi:voltage-gated potassium channel
MQTNPIFQIRVILTTLLLLIIGGTVLFHSLEDYTIIQSFYFTVTTMTTVGFGDIVPTNDTTRLAVSLYILVSVSLYISLATHFGPHYLQYHHNRAKKKKGKNKNK